MIVIEISSKEKFLNSLIQNIDSEEHIFNLPKKKYRGVIKFDRFILKENQIRRNRATFYKITGIIKDTKVKLKIEPTENTYLLIIFQIIWYLGFIFLPSDDEKTIALLFILIGLGISGFWFFRFVKRKSQIIDDFKTMAN